MQQGTSWNCYRFDTIGGTPLLGYSFHPYTGEWQKNLVLDTLDKTSPNYGTYRDSSYEVFTVRGTITIGELKKYFLNPSASFPSYYNNYFSYIVNYPDASLAKDSSNCSILLVNNKSRNTVDTEFVFLSKSYFAIMPQISRVVQSSGTISLGTDPSLINIGITLSGVKPIGNSFLFQNRQYLSDLFISSIYSTRAPSGISGSYDSTAISFSASKGLLQHYNYNFSYTPISYPREKTNRVNVTN